MQPARVIVVTGLPGTGKSTLARDLAARYRMPVLAKDSIKEPLLDVLGARDAAQSRRLSDASFAALFRLAGEWASAGHALILEGNFRPGEHERPLGAALSSVRVMQILCRVPEAERLAHLAARASDPARHAGHRFGEQLSATLSTPAAMAGATSGSRGGDAFLEMPSDRVLHERASHRTVLEILDDWMNLSAASPRPSQSSEPSR